MCFVAAIALTLSVAAWAVRRASAATPTKLEWILRENAGLPNGLRTYTLDYGNTRCVLVISELGMGGAKPSVACH